MTTVPGPYILGVDLGKATDHTALVLAEPTRATPPAYHLRHIERVPLKTRYTAAAEHVKRLVAGLRAPVEVTEFVPAFGANVTTTKRPEMQLILDYTGVGIAVAEIFLDAKIDCSIVLLTITGGIKVTVDEVGIHVPKKDLVSCVERVLQEERLKMPADDPATDLLGKELGDFQAILRPSGTVQYGNAGDWRTGQHDDLVLATALALWFGESRPHLEIW